MTRDADRSADHRSTEALAQRRVARHYRILGYDVLEKPPSDRLPDFMRGVTPDIVALSDSDNVVIGVKRQGSLKGSNDLVDIAERVSRHPDWRFELVVLNNADRSVGAVPDLGRVGGWVRRAISVQLLDMAYISLVDILMRIVRGVAGAHRLRSMPRSDEDLLVRLGFQGILPDDVIDECLAALSARNRLVHAESTVQDTSEEELRRLLRLCERLGGLVEPVRAGATAAAP